MCRKRPGVRCSDHPRKKMAQQLTSYNKAVEDLKEVTASLKAGGLKKQSEKALTTRKTSLENKLAHLDEALKLSELEYNATPDGRRELEEKISVEPEGERKEFLKVDLDVAQERRQWQHDMSRKLDEVEQNEGPEQAVITAEIERDQARFKQDKAERAYEAAERRYVLEQRKDRKLRSRVKLSRIRKLMHRLDQLVRFYKLVTGDLNGFIKSKARSVMIQSSAKAGSWFAEGLFAGDNKNKEATKVSTPVN